MSLEVQEGVVLFGCGSVAEAKLFEAHGGLFQTALVWGIACSLAIYAMRNLSCAHLKPGCNACDGGRRWVYESR